MISIVMSTYNEAEEHLDMSIQSILNQTMRDFEFIIVLDNPQNTIIKSLVFYYQQLDTRITVIENEQNKGLALSLNEALRHAKGEYIARMDADDISYPDRLERQLDYLKNNELDLVGALVCCIDENNKIIEGQENRYYSVKALKHCLRNSDLVPHPTWFVKREVYQKLNGYRNFVRCEDYDFLLRALKQGVKIGLCNEILLKYRVNKLGLSQTGQLMQQLSSAYISKEYKRIEDITEYEIIKNVHCRISETECKFYAIANEIFVKALSYRRSNPIKCYFLLLKVINISRFFKVRMISIVKNNIIRLIFR